MGEPAVAPPPRTGPAVRSPFGRHARRAAAAAARRTRRAAPALTTALAVLLLTDALRVFLPSLITLFGRAGDTPPERMGAFAALWFLLPLAAVPAARPAGPRPVLLAGAALLGVARLALQATGGGTAQLYVSGAGVSAGLVVLYGCARVVPRRSAPAGLAAGLAAAAIVQLALDQVDLAWRPGPWPFVAVAALCVALPACARLVPSTADPASWHLWFLFGPALALHGMYLATIGLAGPDGGAGQDPVARAVTVGLLVAGQLAMASFAAAPPARWQIAVAVFPLSAWLLIAADSPIPALIAAPALGACLGVAAAPRAAGPARGGGALLGGTLVFLVAVFAYYAAYDADLGFPNRLVPVLLAALVGGVAFAAGRGRRMLLTAPPPGRAAVAVTIVVAVTVAAITWRPPPAARAVTGDGFTVVAYNIRMGFGLSGRLDLDRVAGWVRGTGADVVLLSEVDRGWLLNGGHDGLARIARGLGMRHYFAPAADALWGDAVLTNLPVRQIASHPLGRHGYPTGAQAQAVVLEVGGTEVGVVNTHLQSPPGQAPEVAAIARDLAAGVPARDAGTPRARRTGPARPLLLAGDLNTTPADPEMRVLTAAGLADPLPAFGDPPTSPADRPVRRIDHLLVSPGLTVTGAWVPRVPFSDHLPVAARVRVTSVKQAG
ncbi:hypothetical protein Sru01_32550 [Sphaerisporangium rufum]|uniref:Endonuclease/exonuclease/phosphatase domain-containing protein n=1 Tax=Sphaerisporangium rufum TaxID=1381558 RepID=A0A919R2T1_9ACTN|nr:endonuclease/exonuclease/phosphatase family protein [Sphaerisporangium rufum]GII78273.1 hypothetical protein Sru01_32550 [Sphaerisporangium rufum]